jgi:hypothetical protein
MHRVYIIPYDGVEYHQVDQEEECNEHHSDGAHDELRRGIGLRPDNLIDIVHII